jgi:urea transport system ATP-binding protein
LLPILAGAAIGCALVTRPKLLILDESTEGIQPSIVQQIDDAIKAIQKELKISILLVEQFLDFVGVDR